MHLYSYCIISAETCGEALLRCVMKVERKGSEMSILPQHSWSVSLNPGTARDHFFGKIQTINDYWTAGCHGLPPADTPG